jgi:uncharacterized repeat protein (TIGR03803 family)
MVFRLKQYLSLLFLRVPSPRERFCLLMKKLRLISALVLAVFIVVFQASALAQTATETILYSFADSSSAPFSPYAGLVFDPAGNLYGTAYSGDAENAGGVFMLSPVAGGGWEQTTIYSFTGGADGGKPYYAGVILDSAGNLYGTTYSGGSMRKCTGGCGTVFELSPLSGGGWQETVLYAFNGGADGENPRAGLVFDAEGNLYGTTLQGGNLTACTLGCGTAFKLTPSETGQWKKTILRTFNGTTDGANPHAGLVFDSAGNLYGTNYWGGTTPACPAGDCGTVFELTPTVKGPWQERVLHAFTNAVDGGNPGSNVTFDAAGNIYGTTSEGGHTSDCGGLGCGTIYKLEPTKTGPWTGSVIRAFSGPDGANLVAGVIFDAAGNMYGASPSGTGSHVDGLVFKFTPHTTGPWSQTVLHGFSGVKGDGKNPQGGVIFDSAGNLYSTTANGGTGGGGTVFEITP